ncbi:MAG TPA: response regulator [Candidatus Thermoplasmatota archaeon]|nr:response regulator [Candidatus Thermoplasmatota archaeon]
MGHVAPGEATGERTFRLLVADDIPEIGELFTDLLERLRGFDVQLTTEADSRAALELARTRPFDVVVSDFRMGEVDGVEVLRAARLANPSGRRVLMTGYQEIPAPMSRIREANVDAYLQKPLRGRDLLVLLGDLLRADPDVLEACRREARRVEAMGLREEAG